MTHQHTERLRQAHPLHQARMDELLRRAPLPLLIVRVYARPEEQLEKWKVGRTFVPALGQWEVTGTIVTRAAPGTSAHETVTAAGLPAAVATDIVPLTDKGAPWWNAPDSVWQSLYSIAAKHCGLDAYGDPHGRYLGWDKGHMEEPGFQIVLPALGIQMPDVSKLTVTV